MDLYKYLRELHDEKSRLDRVIHSLEEVVEQRMLPPAPARRRGRKPGMADDERRLISERMRNYWAQRKALAKGNTAG